uniref:RIKEN cDNA 1700056E22 gene n=1 Tax=Jaculus jaculus TaxID=51337 RepID=A0A8C5LCE0_JACJA
MSLPLRLPYSSPARRLRAVLLFPCFCAPLTPPPSPACSQDPDSDTDGGASSEGCPLDDAWLYVPGGRGRAFSGCAGASTRQGWAGPGPLSLPHVPPPKPGPPSNVAPGPLSRGCVRRPQPTRPPLLNRRPSAAKGSWPAKDRQPGILGGKEPESSVSSRKEYDRLWRIGQFAPPTLPAPRAAARGVAASRGEAPGGKKSAKVCQPASASQEKNPATCRKIVLEVKKGVGKPR